MLSHRRRADPSHQTAVSCLLAVTLQQGHGEILLQHHNLRGLHGENRWTEQLVFVLGSCLAGSPSGRKQL